MAKGLPITETEMYQVADYIDQTLGRRRLYRTNVSSTMLSMQR